MRWGLSGRLMFTEEGVPRAEFWKINHNDDRQH